MRVLLVGNKGFDSGRFVTKQAAFAGVLFSVLNDVADVKYVLQRYMHHAVLIAGHSYTEAMHLVKTVCLHHSRLSVIVVGDYTSSQIAEMLMVGADDVCSRNVCKDYLCERIVTCCRRRQGRFDSSIVIGDLVYDELTSVVTYAGRAVPLSIKVKSVLYLLMMNHGKISVTDEVALDYLYGTADKTPGVKIISVFAYDLRKALVEAGAPEGIVFSYCKKLHLCPYQEGQLRAA